MNANASNTGRHTHRRALLAAFLLILSASLPTAAVAVPIMKILELSREGALVTYNVGENGYGKAVVSMCDSCGEFLELDITPRTRLILDGRDVSFADHPAADGSRMTVFYLPDEKRLTRIVATSPPQ